MRSPYYSLHLSSKFSSELVSPTRSPEVIDSRSNRYAVKLLVSYRTLAASIREASAIAAKRPVQEAIDALWSIEIPIAARARVCESEHCIAREQKLG